LNISFAGVLSKSTVNFLGGHEQSLATELFKLPLKTGMAEKEVILLIFILSPRENIIIQKIILIVNNTINIILIKFKN